MRYVAIRHNQAVVTYYRLPLRSGSAVYRDKLAKRGAVTDADIGLLTFEFQVLRYCADNGTGEYVAVLADARTRTNGDIAVNDGALADFHILFNADKRANLNRRRYLRLGMNIC